MGGPYYEVVHGRSIYRRCIGGPWEVNMLRSIGVTCEVHMRYMGGSMEVLLRSYRGPPEAYIREVDRRFIRGAHEVTGRETVGAVQFVT